MPRTLGKLMSTTSPREEFKPSQCKEVNKPTSQQLWMFIPHHPMSTHPPGRCSSYNLLFQMFRFNFSLSEWWDWKGVEQRITGADSQSPAVEGELDRGRLGLGGAWVVCTVLIWRVVDHIDGGFTAAARGGGGLRGTDVWHGGVLGWAQCVDWMELCQRGSREIV